MRTTEIRHERSLISRDIAMIKKDELKKENMESLLGRDLFIEHADLVELYMLMEDIALRQLRIADANHEKVIYSQEEYYFYLHDTRISLEEMGREGLPISISFADAGIDLPYDQIEQKIKEIVDAKVEKWRKESRAFLPAVPFKEPIWGGLGL